MGAEEEELAKAASDDGSNPDDGDSVKAKKRKERLEQNRISARESRKRKKTMIEELQRTVITLSRENKELNERNEGLRRQLMEIGTKYPNVVPMQAIMGGLPPVDQQQAAPAAGGGAPAPPPQAMGMAFPTMYANPAGMPQAPPAGAIPFLQQAAAQPAPLQPAPAPLDQQQQQQMFAAQQAQQLQQQQQQQAAPAPVAENK